MAYKGFTTPTLEEIKDRVVSDIETNLPGEGAKLYYSPLNALAAALTGITHELYGYLNWISQQTNVIACEGQNLDEWGAVWGVTRLPAEYATGLIDFTGTTTALIPSGSVLQSEDGLYFKTTANGTLGGVGQPKTATIAAQALTPGKSFNIPSGLTLTLTNPISGVNSDAISEQFTSGADVEADDPYRDRIRSRIRENGHGGNAKDYKDWALSVPGVTRAWVTTKENGPLSVTVRFMMDDNYANGLPLSGDITTVNNLIQAKKPILSYVTVQAPGLTSVNLTIDNLNPDTPTIRSNITAELKEMFREKSEPGGQISLSWIYNAIAQASGNTSFDLVTPTANITAPAGNICRLGTITYV